jgi:hypothetical protein
MDSGTGGAQCLNEWAMRSQDTNAEVEATPVNMTG